MALLASKGEELCGVVAHRKFIVASQSHPPDLLGVDFPLPLSPHKTRPKMAREGE
jgi:hypothetical protein